MMHYRLLKSYSNNSFQEMYLQLIFQKENNDLFFMKFNLLLKGIIIYF